jgi:hypothetical protein
MVLIYAPFATFYTNIVRTTHSAIGQATASYSVAAQPVAVALGKCPIILADSQEFLSPQQLSHILPFMIPRT